MTKDEALTKLQEIIDSEFPDISFGYGQRIVAYHWLGNGSGSIDNVLRVRDGVFSDHYADILNMATRLRTCRSVAVIAGAEPIFGALIVYNAGHYPDAGSSWWQRYAGNVANIRSAILMATEWIKG